MSASAWVFISLVKDIKKEIWNSDTGPKIDSVVQRLNHKVTVSLLLLFSCIITFHNWFGLGKRPLECIFSEAMKDINQEHFEQYCWMHPMNISIDNKKWSQDDVDQNLPGIPLDKGETVFTFQYYQWAAFFFLFQAACFTLPRVIWAGIEDGFMAHLVSSMESVTEDEEKADMAARRLVIRKKRGTNRMYAWSSVACEALSFLNIFFQWWITNNFIGSADTSEWPELKSQVNFYTLGWMSLAADRSYLPTNILFPRQIECKLSVHGLGGDRATTGALCLLPLNIIHDKLFLALWFWLLFVSIVTGLHFTYRMVMVSNCDWRQSKLDWELLKGESENERDRRQWISGVSAHYPDYAVFQIFRKNCSKIVARKVVKKMYEELVKED